MRRDSSYANGYAGDIDPENEYEWQSRRPRIHLSFHGGLLPKSLWGRIAMSCALLLLAGAGVAAGLWVHNYLLHDDHFTVSTSQSIQIAGNSRLTRAQLLSVFGEDVDRNIFYIPLAQRRAELERLPWVEHATVMRLLPNRVRVAIVERTPVAFVRQGTEIGLVDANGVLLNLPGPDLAGASADDSTGQPSQSMASNAPHYSFPVLTGISADDPLSVRAARMKIYLGFVAALDATGENISRRLSEVDVSNPEDVKAILPDPAPGGADPASAAADILVHFGDGKYLERYRQYEQHLAEWRAQYPKLASVDLRYERQVVLEMQPGASAVAKDAVAAGSESAASTESASADSVTPEAQKAAATPKAHAAAAKPKGTVAAKKLTGKPAASAAVMQGDAR
ncbi:MAG: cell division protein FtsQ/DivIB [Acidobacteriaceae bacterium]